jgi:HD superfamily phosphodiesterase
MIPEKDVYHAAAMVDLYQPILNNVYAYMQSFSSEEPHINHNFNLKKEHTDRVIANSLLIAKKIGSDENQTELIRLAAALHDIGRFEQFTQYQTFNDSLSTDHAEIASKLIEEKGWLETLPAEYCDLINKAVGYHNKLTLPKEENVEVTIVCKVIRDADKIDILELAVKEYGLPIQKRNKSFSLDLNDSPIVTREVAKSIIEGKLPDKKELKTVTDFKLLQMAFVYDLNFKYSFSYINQKQLLKKLFETLPKNDDTFELYRTIKIHVENQLIG